MPSHHALALLSQDAYRPKSETHSCGGVEATFRLVDGEQILSIRGTGRNGIDILRDLRGLPWYDKRLNAWCHSGFLKGARGFLQGTSILGDIDPHWPLIIDGHSLGGALAIGVGSYLTLLGRRPTEIVTFGAPAFSYGGAVGRILKGIPKTRYRYGIDIVPTVPPFGEHAAELTRLDADDDDLFLNHRIQEYIDALAP